MNRMCDLPTFDQPVPVPQFANPRPDLFGETEWQLRVELAGAYRLVSLLGMDDTIFTHLSVRVPGPAPTFLINPYGMLFEEVTASTLVRVDADGFKVSESAWPVNPAGFNIHSAIHLGAPNAHCVMHTHTLAGMAVAANPQGLLPLNQISLHFHDRIGRYSYDTIHFPPHEKTRMVQALGAHHALIMENHGLLTCGETVAEAFYYLYYLEQACRLQMHITASPGPYLVPTPAVCEEVAALIGTRPEQKRTMWAAFLRKIAREAPDFAT